jgi:hypothetical protein
LSISNLQPDNAFWLRFQNAGRLGGGVATIIILIPIPALPGTSPSRGFLKFRLVLDSSLLAADLDRTAHRVDL